MFDEPSSKRPTFALRVLDVSIDPSRHTIVKAGEEVQLRPKSFQLLDYLAENHSRLVPKEELLEQIWKRTTVTDGTLAGCILEIRKALGDDSKTPRFIKTVHGVGYQFLPVPEPVLPVPEPVLPVPEPVQHAAPVVETKQFPWRPAALVTAGLAMAILGWGIVGRSEPPDLYRETAWWKLDEGRGTRVADSAGQLHGTVSPEAAWTTGVLGSALRLDGKTWSAGGGDDHRQLPLRDSARSIAAWVRVDAPVPEAAPLVQFRQKVHPNMDVPALFLLPDGRGGFGMGGFGDEALKAAGRIDDGRWHHLAASFAGSSGEAILYVDGVPRASGALKNVPQAAKDRVEWMLGKGDGSLRGALDDVRIYSRVLRAAEVEALHRCGTGHNDIEVAGQGGFYFLTLFQSVADDRMVTPIAVEGAPGSSAIRHVGSDYGGVQFSRRAADCAVASLRGANIGQDLYFSAELLVPSPDGNETQAGPYFRSRAAAGGDGILGGTSAGFWVRLHSSGVVTVRRLNPISNIAFTAAIPGFDASKFHRLAMAVRGTSLQVSLDGKAVVFDQAGKVGEVVLLDEAWKTVSPAGRNQGTAGIAFGSEPARRRSGGQMARAIEVGPYRALPQR
jgi:hypothetical protein